VFAPHMRGTCKTFQQRTNKKVHPILVATCWIKLDTLYCTLGNLAGRAGWWVAAGEREKESGEVEAIAMS